MNLSRLSWTDVSLVSVAWTEEGRDLAFTFRVSPDERRRILHAEWAEALRVDLSYPPMTSGFPLSWDVEIGETDEGAQAVRMDFAPTGEISFRCRGLRVEEETAA
jgi:hypothetical protein